MTKSKSVRLFNERVKVIDDNAGVVLYARVADDGDFWIEDAQSDTAIYVPKAAINSVITALTRVKGF